MRAFQKLVRNGNATAVTIPRAALFELRWLPGDYVLLSVQEDKSIRIEHVPIGAIRDKLHSPAQPTFASVSNP